MDRVTWRVADAHVLSQFGYKPLGEILMSWCSESYGILLMSGNKAVFSLLFF